MLKWCLIFLVAAMVLTSLGFPSLGHDAAYISKILFCLFLGLTLFGVLFAVVTLVLSLLSRF